MEKCENKDNNDGMDIRVYAEGKSALMKSNKKIKFNNLILHFKL